MSIELYNQNGHSCIAFENNNKGGGIQANQFLIADDNEGVLLDPGGNLAYKGLMADITAYLPPHKLKYLLASHQDPDIIASVQAWLLMTDVKVLIPQMWTRFLPHFCSSVPDPNRLIGIDDLGGQLRIGRNNIRVIPAHYLHSVANVQVYDPISKILFSGDLGASDIKDTDAIAEPVKDFAAHVKIMNGFHRRIMVSQKTASYWANMVRQLDIEWIVPQHGLSFKGKDMVERFIQWVESTPCGIDLVSQESYRLVEQPIV